MKKRHVWLAERTKARWRVIERCAHCNTRRWSVEFFGSRGERRATFLYSAWYDPWSIGQPDCSGPTKGSAR